MNPENTPARERWDRFIVFEGIDGSGRTTQRNLLADFLAERSIPLFSTAEPTNSEIGRMIRRVLAGDLLVRPETLAYLYATDRHEHLYGAGGVRERLHAGELVICDRYLFSSLAYQGRSCGADLPERLNLGFPLPTLLVYFDMPPEQAFSRIAGRETPDIFEKRDFLSEVSESYEGVLGRFESQGLDILRIDGSLPIQEVALQVREAVLAVIEP